MLTTKWVAALGVESLNTCGSSACTPLYGATSAHHQTRPGDSSICLSGTGLNALLLLLAESVFLCNFSGKIFQITTGISHVMLCIFSLRLPCKQRQFQGFCVLKNGYSMLFGLVPIHLSPFYISVQLAHHPQLSTVSLMMFTFPLPITYITHPPPSSSNYSPRPLLW